MKHCLIVNDYFIKCSNTSKNLYKLIVPLAVILVAPSACTLSGVLISILAAGSILVLDGGFLIGLLLFPATIRLPGTLT